MGGNSDLGQTEQSHQVCQDKNTRTTFWEHRVDKCDQDTKQVFGETEATKTEGKACGMGLEKFRPFCK